MSRALRLALAVAVAAIVSTVSVAVAGGFTRGLTPGHTTTLTQFAFGGLDDAAGNHVQIFAQTGGVTFRQRGGAVITQNGSVVDIFASTSDGLFGFGCWVVPSSAIVFNIQTTVTVTFDSAAAGVTECPGTPLGAAFSAAPAPTLADPSVFGFTGRVAMNVTFVQSGALNFRTITMNVTCGQYSAVDQQQTRNFGTAPSVSVPAMTLEGVNSAGVFEDVGLSGLSGAGDFGDVSDITDNLVVNGPATGSCGQFGS